MKVKTILSVILSAIIIVFIIKYIHDRIILSSYINTIIDSTELDDNYSYNDLLKIRDFIERDIDHDSREISLERPKIGWSIGKIINRRQGLCGEGTRLLYHIYNKLGFNSRRVYLHGNTKVHVLLEVKIDNMWVLIESINGPGKYFTEYLDISAKSISDYFLYGPWRYHVTPKEFMYEYGYYNYSYLPLNGLLNNKYTFTEVYVHRPMPAGINYILETPYLLYLTFLLGVLLLININYIFKSISKIINTAKQKFGQSFGISGKNN